MCVSLKFKRLGWLIPSIGPALAVSTAAPQLARDDSRQATKTLPYSDRMAFGHQELVIGNSIALFAGSLRAKNFFSGLEKSAGPAGVTFSRLGVPIEYYPEILSVERVAYEPRLARKKLKTKKGEAWPADPIPELMDSLRFKAEWKRGMELRPVDGISSTRVLGEPGSIDGIREQWTFRFLISAENVPLTDHLIMTVLSSDNTMLLRMAAAP